MYKYLHKNDINACTYIYIYIYKTIAGYLFSKLMKTRKKIIC